MFNYTLDINRDSLEIEWKMTATEIQGTTDRDDQWFSLVI